MATPGIIISAPASGAGKTTITLGILRALRDEGLNVSAAKIGPDYIDSEISRASQQWPMRKPRYLGNEQAAITIFSQ